MVDFILVTLFAVIYPWLGYFGYRRLLARLAAGLPVPRLRLYRSTLVSQWLLLTAAMTAWFYQGRSAAELGLRLAQGDGFTVAALLTLAALIVLWRQLQRVQDLDCPALDRQAAGLGALLPMIPTNRTELHWFYAVGSSAGIVEEILWRGYFFWLLSLYVAPWTAGLAVTLLFGVAHAYQGWDKLPQLVLVGALFLILYLLTGSLLLPMVLHVAVDVLQGRLAYELVTRKSV